MLATRRNCSKRFLKTKLYTVYLAVMTWFVANIHCRRTRPRLSYASFGNSILIITRLDDGGGRLRLNAVSGLRSICFSFRHMCDAKARKPRSSPTVSPESAIVRRTVRSFLHLRISQKNKDPFQLYTGREGIKHKICERRVDGWTDLRTNRN